MREPPIAPGGSGRHRRPVPPTGKRDAYALKQALQLDPIVAPVMERPPHGPGGPNGEPQPDRHVHSGQQNAVSRVKVVIFPEIAVFTWRIPLVVLDHDGRIVPNMKAFSKEAKCQIRLLIPIYKKLSVAAYTQNRWYVKKDIST